MLYRIEIGSEKCFFLTACQKGSGCSIMKVEITLHKNILRRQCNEIAVKSFRSGSRVSDVTLCCFLGGLQVAVEVRDVGKSFLNGLDNEMKQCQAFIVRSRV